MTKQTMLPEAAARHGRYRKVIFMSASPQETGMNPQVLAELASDIKTAKIKNIHALLIMKDDKLIVEEYFDGNQRNDLQYSASITKSLASTLLGIAIDRGYFKGSVQRADRYGRWPAFKTH